MLREKSFAFALTIIQTFRSGRIEPNDYILVKQLIRSGTSIGANIEEAIGACSEKEFLMKLTIAYKEARESLFWLRLMKESTILGGERSSELIERCEELCRIMSAIQRTMKQKHAKKL